MFPLVLLCICMHLISIRPMPVFTEITDRYTGPDERKILVLSGPLGRPAPPQDIQSLFEAFPVYKTVGEEFVMAESAEIGPRNLLYVQQRELAASHPTDKNVEIIGSDDATTCIVAILRHSGSGAAALAHFDGLGGERGAHAMVERVLQLTPKGAEGWLELFLVGGVLENVHTADKVYSDLINGFHKQIVEIDLVLACIGELNTLVRTDTVRPIFYGAGVRLKTGEIFPATFSDKGPDQALRAVRSLTGAPQLLDVYDYRLGAIKIGPFDYRPMSNLKTYLNMDDRTLLQRISTTPTMEPPQFIPQIRAALKFQLENPKPLKTVFKDNKPHYFRRDANGLWTPFQQI